MAWRFSDVQRRRLPGPLPVVFALSLLAASAGTSFAQQLDGEALADACTSCHGVAGHSTGSVPSLVGKDKAALLAALTGFKAGKGDPTIMNRIVRGYSDAELEALAGYFSSLGGK
ncbi:MAG TPA: c-type cytochrome [Devosia sp.]|nr:c-type cytochrome [Devosia sp.]